MTTDLENREQTTIEPSQATMTGQQWLDHLASMGELTDNWLVRLKEAEKGLTGHSNVAGVMRGNGNRDIAVGASGVDNSGLNHWQTMVNDINSCIDNLQQTYDRYDDFKQASKKILHSRTTAENRASHRAQRASMNDKDRLATAQQAAEHEIDITVNSSDGIAADNTEKATMAAAAIGSQAIDNMADEANATMAASSQEMAISNEHKLAEDQLVMDARRNRPMGEDWTPEMEQEVREDYRRENNLDLETREPLPEGTGTVLAHGTGTQITASPVLIADGDSDFAQVAFGEAASLEGINSELVSANPNMSLDADGELRQNTVVVTPSGSYVRTLDMDAGV